MTGDPEALLAVKRERFDPVATVVGAENGMIFHLCARTDDGLLVLNLWESRDGSEATSRRPAAAGEGRRWRRRVPRSSEHYEVDQSSGSDERPGR